MACEPNYRFGRLRLVDELPAFEVHGRRILCSVTSCQYAHLKDGPPADSVGFYVDEHPLDPGDDRACLFLHHAYIEVSDAGTNLILRSYGTVKIENPILQAQIDHVSALARSYVEFVKYLMVVLDQSDDTDFSWPFTTEVAA